MVAVVLGLVPLAGHGDGLAVAGLQPPAELLLGVLVDFERQAPLLGRGGGGATGNERPDHGDQRDRRHGQYHALHETVSSGGPTAPTAVGSRTAARPRARGVPQTKEEARKLNAGGGT